MKRIGVLFMICMLMLPAHAQDVTTWSFSKEVIVEGQKVTIESKNSVIGSGGDVISMVKDALTTAAVAAEISVQLDKLGKKSPGMRCYDLHSGERLDCTTYEPLWKRDENAFRG